jgi:hypothetical protein
MQALSQPHSHAHTHACTRTCQRRALGARARPSPQSQPGASAPGCTASACSSTAPCCTAAPPAPGNTGQVMCCLALHTMKPRSCCPGMHAQAVHSTHWVAAVECGCLLELGRRCCVVPLLVQHTAQVDGGLHLTARPALLQLPPAACACMCVRVHHVGCLLLLLHGGASCCHRLSHLAGCPAQTP